MMRSRLIELRRMLKPEGIERPATGWAADETFEAAPKEKKKSKEHQGELL